MKNLLSSSIIQIITLGLCCLPMRAQQPAFPLPDIPESLTTTEECLEYLLLNYWNQYDFDDASPANQLAGEQGFVNFIDIMPTADSLLCARSMALYVEKALATAERITRFDQLADHYLANRLSPIRNDIIYAHLLRQAIGFYSTAEHRKTHSAALQRTRFLLENIDKNQVGTVASDFKFTDSDGRRRRLSNIQSPFVLIMLYDPECYDCILAKQDMETQPVFQNPDIKIIRVLPSQVKGKYHVTATPSFYLLNSKHVVLLKDATYESILQFFEHKLK